MKGQIKKIAMQLFKNCLKTTGTINLEYILFEDILRKKPTQAEINCAKVNRKVSEWFIVGLR